MFFLILAIVVVLFGLGVVVVNRRRERRLSLERARPPTKPVQKPPPEVLEPEGASPDLAEPGVVDEVDVEVRKSRRSRTKSSRRLAFAIGSVRPAPRSLGHLRRCGREAASPKTHGTSSRRP